MRRNVRRHRSILTACAIAAALTAGCGSSDQPDTPISTNVVQKTPVAGSGGSSHGDSGASAPPKVPTQHWRGIQSCSGYSGRKNIATTSDETTIASYSKTKTRVSVVGVHVGPSAEFSCAKALNFEGVVTNNSGGLTDFTGNGMQTCVSPSGTPLDVTDFGGDDIDTRTVDGLGELELDFEVRLSTPDDPDAGFPDFSMETNIICKFELKLM
jgi:hypothetical protein